MSLKWTAWQMKRENPVMLSTGERQPRPGELLEQSMALHSTQHPVSALACCQSPYNLYHATGKGLLIRRVENSIEH